MAFGLEGWVSFEKTVYGNDVCYLVSWVVFMCADGKTNTWWGEKHTIPNEISLRLKAGEDLWPIIDQMTGKKDHNHLTWATWFFTDDLITREDLFTRIVINSLVPWICPKLF